MPAPTIADLRTVASAIDSPEGEHEALILRGRRAAALWLAESSLLNHDDSLLIEALRGVGWCDTDVRECVAAVSEALRALEAAE